MRSGLFKLPGTTNRLTVSKFFRDSSSFQVVLPGESGCKTNIWAVEPPWHEMHRAWPGRLARKMGCTLVLKNSKFSDGGAVEDGTGCWLSNPTSKTQQTTTVDTCPPHLPHL